MNILLTNDDGFDSVGIRILKEKLSKYGHVVIMAPKGAMSAKSCSKTFGVSLPVVEEEKDIFSCGGTPADCVAVALTSLSTKFDLVVSGVNNGLNIANDTLYSGTIGACLEALTYGVPAIAMSCEFNFEIVEKYFDDVWKFIIDNDLISNQYLLNVNYPKGKVVKDIQLGSLYYRNDHNFFIKNDGNGFQAFRDIQTEFSEEYTDCYQVENDIVSIVPLNRGLYCPQILKDLQNKMKK